MIGCHNISDTGIIELATNIPTLKFLDISQSSNITTYGIKEVLCLRSPDTDVVEDTFDDDCADNDYYSEDDVYDDDADVDEYGDYLFQY
jgi:hypothetical protein